MPEIFLRFALGFAGVVFVLTVALWQMPDGRMHVWFFDIGQGDSTFVRTPEGHKILIDGGPGDTGLENLGEVMPYFDHGIDLIILTHPHADHIDGLVEVLKRYDVGTVLFSGVDYKSSVYDEFLGEILDDVRFVIAWEETDFLLGPVFLDVIYPFEQIYVEKFANLNNSSVIFQLVYGDLKILFTGDAESEVEKELVLRGILDDADVLQVGHHGSNTSSGMDFLEAVSPELAVISSGSGNQFGHPHKETLERLELIGAEIRRTDLEGTIELVF